MDDAIKRIQYYTRKVKEYALDKRPSHQRNRYRYGRLLAYKVALIQRIREVDGNVQALL